MPYDEAVLVTDPAQYLVHGKRATHIWLEVLHGDDQGIRVSVPRYHETGDSIEEYLAAYEEHDVLTATLESPTQTPPQWRVRDIYED